jgi:hypothetical protein
LRAEGGVGADDEKREGVVAALLPVVGCVMGVKAKAEGGGGGGGSMGESTSGCPSMDACCVYA